ncbi:MAG: autotransporter domain-containing protein [Rhizobiaceae bacterium]|nr:autotransporter domain-containing protein [Rhizobiaceae bacterium]
MAFGGWKRAISGAAAGASFLALSLSVAYALPVNIANGGTDPTNYDFDSILDDLEVTVGGGLLAAPGEMSGDITSSPGSTFRLIKRGSGVLELSSSSGNTNYSGETAIEEGGILVTDDWALSPNSAIAISAGAQLEIDVNVWADAGTLRDGIGGGGKVILGAGSELYIGNDDRDGVFSGSIEGDGSLIAAGGGKQVLTGTSNIGGDLVVDSCGCFRGTLEIRGGPMGGSFTVGQDIVVSNGVLAVTQGGKLIQSDPSSATLVYDELMVDGVGSLVSASTVIIFPGAHISVTGGARLVQTNVNSSLSSVGGLRVADAGSAVVVEGSFNATAGTVSVTGGASLTQLDANTGLAIGDRMIVDGRGTRVSIAGSTQVGTGLGAASLRISGGAVFDGKQGAFVETFFGDKADVLVSGTGTEWLLGELPACLCMPNVSLFIGDEATVTVADGALVKTTKTIAIDPGGLLRIGTGKKGGTVDAPDIVNDGGIVANFTDKIHLDADISGIAGLVKAGAGELVLGGKNTYTGATTVNGGILTVNGSALGTIVTVNQNGTLGGTGIVGETIVNGGTIGPGRSIGTLTIANRVTFGAGSIFEVEVGSTADRLVVVRRGGPGVALLSGATVKPVYVGTGLLRRDYRILTAAGGFGGTRFAGLGVTPPGIIATLVYDGNSIGLHHELALSRISGLNQNQQAVADALDAHFKRFGTIPIFLAALDPKGLSIASGEVSNGALGAGVDAADRFLGLISDPANGSSTAAGPSAYAEERAAKSDRFARVLGTSARHSADNVDIVFADRWKVWGGAYGGSTEIRGDATVVGSHDTATRAYGIAGGIERAVGNGAVGIALGGGWSSFVLADGMGSGDAGTFNAGVYANQAVGSFYVAVAGAYGYHDVSTIRAVPADTIRGDFGAHSWSGRVEGGYRLDTPVATIAPYAAAQAISYRMPGYAETFAGSGVFALDYDARSLTATRFELGARLEHLIPLGDDRSLKLTGRAAWAINGGTDRRAFATFQALPGASFMVQGAEPSRHSALVDAGAEFGFGRGLSFGATFQGEFSRTLSSYGAKGKLSYRW